MRGNGNVSVVTPGATLILCIATASVPGNISGMVGTPPFSTMQPGVVGAIEIPVISSGLGCDGPGVPPGHIKFACAVILITPTFS